MKKSEPISLREYAKKVGTSHQTVSTAIKDGKIVAGYNPKTKKIDPDVADIEWGLDFASKQLIKRVQESDFAGFSDEELDYNSDEPEIARGEKVSELIRLDMLYKARLAKTKYEKERGKLVDYDEMYKEFFEFGKELRLRIQAIPDRIIDQLIVSDRSTAHKILKTAINEALEKLAEAETVE